MTRFVSLLALMVAMTLSAMADAHAAPDAVHSCSSVVEPAERLRCFDRAFPPTSVVREAEADRGVREFGLDKPPAPRQPESVAADPASIEERVTGLTSAADGTRVVTLGNGQAWALTEGASRGHLAVGDQVRLRKAALGSYMLVTPAGVPLRARRLR